MKNNAIGFMTGYITTVTNYIQIRPGCPGNGSQALSRSITSGIFLCPVVGTHGIFMNITLVGST